MLTLMDEEGVLSQMGVLLFLLLMVPSAYHYHVNYPVIFSKQLQTITSEGEEIDKLKALTLRLSLLRLLVLGLLKL